MVDGNEYVVRVQIQTPLFYIWTQVLRTEIQTQTLSEVQIQAPPSEGHSCDWDSDSGSFDFVWGSDSGLESSSFFAGY